MRKVLRYCVMVALFLGSVLTRRLAATEHCDQVYILYATYWCQYTNNGISCYLISLDWEPTGDDECWDDSATHATVFFQLSQPADNPEDVQVDLSAVGNGTVVLAFEETEAPGPNARFNIGLRTIWTERTFTVKAKSTATGATLSTKTFSLKPETRRSLASDMSTYHVATGLDAWVSLTQELRFQQFTSSPGAIQAVYLFSSAWSISASASYPYVVTEAGSQTQRSWAGSVSNDGFGGTETLDLFFPAPAEVMVTKLNWLKVRSGWDPPVEVLQGSPLVVTTSLANSTPN